MFFLSIIFLLGNGGGGGGVFLTLSSWTISFFIFLTSLLGFPSLRTVLAPTRVSSTISIGCSKGSLTLNEGKP